MKKIQKYISKGFKNDSTYLISATPKKEVRLGGQASKYRGSEFRGVSMNGYKWQIFFNYKKKKQYIGVVESEKKAAELYDIFEIMHFGLKANTNFSYTKAQMIDIISIIKPLIKQ